MVRSGGSSVLSCTAESEPICNLNLMPVPVLLPLFGAQGLLARTGMVAATSNGSPENLTLEGNRRKESETR